MEAIAINVGANTSLPGFRAPIHPDGSFEYVPIPEREPTVEPVPTYGDLDPHLETDVPERLHDRRLHLDPEFASYPFCERYTYGDEHAVKSGPLKTLSAGDYVFFYATLTTVGEAAWLPPKWGAFLIGHFRLASDPVSGTDYDSLDSAARRQYSSNAHTKRDPVDARVFLRGDPEQSRLYDRGVPLSRPDGGSNPGWLVTECSNDSGRGPWWRRPLRFDHRSVETILALASWAKPQAESRHPART